MNESELLKIQEWRYSVKKFDDTKKVPAPVWDALEKSLISSASSYGLQPWKFLVITNPEIRKQLTPLSWNQTQISDCSHFVVFTFLNKMDEAYVENYIQSIAKTRDIAPEKLEGYKQLMLGNVIKREVADYQDWAKRQVYIALGNFLTSAALLNVDTCPMEGLDPAKYDEVLGLKGTEYSTVVACAVGYRHADDSNAKLKKVRFPASMMVKSI